MVFPLKIKTGRSVIIFLFFVSVIASYLINTCNILHLRKEAPELLRENITVKTADDDSYIAPAKNLINYGVLKNNDSGIQSHYLRPPGYSVVISFFYACFGEVYYLLFLRFFQLILFGISVVLLFYSVLNISKHFRVSLFTALFYGLSPIFSGFLFYTLTESVTPAFVILFLYFISKVYDQDIFCFRNLIYSAIVLSVLIIIRPFLAVFIVAYPVMLFKGMQISVKRILRLVLLLCLSLSLFSIWSFRNYRLAHRYVGMHPIYEPTQNSEFRPTHQAIWNFVKVWGEKGEVFHSYMVPLWNESIQGNPTDFTIEKMMANFPPWVFLSINKSELVDALRLYQKSVVYQKQFYDKDLAMPDTIPQIELEVIERFANFRNVLTRNNILQCYLVVPLKVFSGMILHSNLSMYMFQHTYRGHWLMEAIRIFYFCIHSSLFLLFPFYFIRKEVFVKMLPFLLIVSVCIGYLVFVQIGLEERYTLPLLPILLLLAAYLVSRMLLVNKNA